MTAVSALTVISVIDAGFVPALKNRMAEAFARQDNRTFAEYAAASLMFGVLLLLTTLALLPLVARLDWSRFFNLRSPSAMSEATPLMMALLVCGAMSLGTSWIEAVYAARTEISYVLAASTAASLLGFALLVVGIRTQLPLPVLAACTALPIPVGRLGLLARHFLRRRPLIRVQPSRARAILRTLLPSSVVFLLLQVTSVIISAAPNIITAHFIGVTAVASLSIAQRLASLPLMVIASIVPVFWPAFTIAWAKNDRIWLAKTFRRAIYISASLLGAFSFLLWASGPIIVNLWLGGRLGIDRTVFAVFGCWLVSQGLWYWVSTLLNSLSIVGFQVVFGAIQFLLLLMLGIPLAISWHLEGIAVAMTLAVIVGALVPMGIRVRAVLGPRPHSTCVTAEYEAV